MAGLNGRINGTRLDASNTPYDAEQEPDGRWVSSSPSSTAAWARSTDAFEAERPRLEAEIAAAQTRAALARARNADRDTALRAALQRELVDSQSRLADMEREHEAALAALRDATSQRVAQILDAARRRAVDDDAAAPGA